MGDLGSTFGLGRSPGEGKGYPLQCSGPENSVDCIVHGVAKSRTRLSDLHHLKECQKERDGDKGFARKVLEPAMECNFGPGFGACF